MKLKKWLKKQGISYRKFSEMTGIDYTLICRICNGNRNVTLKNALEIQKATKGAIKCEDLV